MSILSLYEKQKSVLTPNTTPTYEEDVFNMEVKGENDLVARNYADPTFRPPLTQDTYLAKNFESKK